ncbi:MAG: FHA domain-containing protein, partial [Myxococcales bacterium]|nr:FHA domain-containing protein [Myxococcales bacterium]
MGTGRWVLRCRSDDCKCRVWRRQSPRTMPRLIVSPGRWDERIYDLQTGSHGIGRGREVAIQVGNKSLSRVHAELVVDDRCNVVLRDLGSKNGTFVDGARITMPTQLFDGQRFV